MRCQFLIPDDPPPVSMATTTANEECECDCWVYNLLYGESPYNNLSYNQIEDALKNVTDKVKFAFRLFIIKSIRKYFEKYTLESFEFY